MDSTDAQEEAGSGAGNHDNPITKSADITIIGFPKTTKESIDTKLSAYLLNPDHPSGGSKAKWYKEALGFTTDNCDELAKQITFDSGEAVAAIRNKFGTKFSQIIPIRGANGRTISVEFIWISNNDGVVRLVTSIPTKK